MSDLSKKELLAMATAADIKGRHDMTKSELEEALKSLPLGEPAGEPVDETASDEPATETADPAPKLRYNKAGNVPYKNKHYYLNLEMHNDIDDEVLAKLPNQVRLIARAMKMLGITSPEDARIGREIVDAAKEKGMIETKIPSANLFAYYRRTLETIGVVHAF